MADASKKEGTDKADAAKPAGKDAGKQASKEDKPLEMAIRLVPVQNSDQPVLANYSSLNIAPGMAFIDFGFIEPGVFAALPRLARQGGKLPETLNGKLSVRVALGYDAAANLHQQLGRMLTGLSNARVARDKKS